jgi:hypothetical protein
MEWALSRRRKNPNAVSFRQRGILFHGRAHFWPFLRIERLDGENFTLRRYPFYLFEHDPFTLRFTLESDTSDRILRQCKLGWKAFLSLPNPEDPKTES